MRRTPIKPGKPMRRSGPIRWKPRRRPEVDWKVLRPAVIERDIRRITVHVKHRFGLETIEGVLRGGRLVYFTPFGEMQWCVAPVVDPAEEGKCDGVITLNHCHEPAQGMIARKPPDDPEHLVMLCAWHHQGSEAGHVWATASENVELQWNYLKEATSGGPDT